MDDELLLMRLQNELIERELLQGSDLTSDILKATDIFVLEYLIKHSECEVKNIDTFEMFMSYHFGSKFNSHQLNELKIGLKNNIDISFYADAKYNAAQMLQIRLGLKHGVDISIYADPKFDFIQMQQIRFGLEDGVDVSLYADPKNDSNKMATIRSDLKKIR